MQVANSLPDLIGRTPLLELNGLFPDSSARIFAKLERMNPMSIKDRPVLNMIRAAMDAGKICTKDSNAVISGKQQVTEVVEASSGNTAIALASLGATMGFRVRVYMSALCSMERQQILCAYGAKVMVTPGSEHTRGARERAIRYCEDHPDSTFFLNQHSNPDNGGAHEKTTGPELWEQLDGKIDAVIIGLGTSGTFDGVSRFMKQKNPDIRIIGFEPAASPVYSGGAQGKHKLIGIGPGFVTENFERSRHNLDELMPVDDEIAYEWVRKIARKEGLLVGPTSGAAAWVAGQIAQRSHEECSSEGRLNADRSKSAFLGKNIVCFFYDTGERYLTTPGLFVADNIEIVE